MENKIYTIKTREGLNNSQSYTRDETSKSTIDVVNFDERFQQILNHEDEHCSRQDFVNLMTDVFTHYRNIRASKESGDFWSIGKEFELKR